jgi:hypothetical protein
MTKIKEHIVEEVEDLEFDDFNSDDYGFILGPDGELKSIMFPEDLIENPPPKIVKILKILGVANIHQLEPRTLH